MPRHAVQARHRLSKPMNDLYALDAALKVTARSPARPAQPSAAKRRQASAPRVLANPESPRCDSHGRKGHAREGRKAFGRMQRVLLQAASPAVAAALPALPDRRWSVPLTASAALCVCVCVSLRVCVCLCVCTHTHAHAQPGRDVVAGACCCAEHLVQRCAMLCSMLSSLGESMMSSLDYSATSPDKRRALRPLKARHPPASRCGPPSARGGANNPVVLLFVGATVAAVYWCNRCSYCRF